MVTENYQKHPLLTKLIGWPLGERLLNKGYYRINKKFILS